MLLEFHNHVLRYIFQLGFIVFAVMGNVSGRKDEAGPSATKNQEGEDYMEFAHGGAQGPFPQSMAQSPPSSPRAYCSTAMFNSQVQGTVSTRNATQNDGRFFETGIPTTITWRFDGKQVGIEGSWDNWKTRDFLERSGKDFTIMKVLQSGVYHYHFIVDGQWRCSPDLPQERDDIGNIFNVLDLQDFVPEDLDNIAGSESPPSPASSYNNTPFSLEDFNEKLPELPPLLLQSPLAQPSSSRQSSESLGKPLVAVLNHLYIQKDRSGQSLVALNSTHRFRTKFVTLVLYKPLKKVKK
ncbi:SNF1-related protein kinase regulatory subunit beta-2-like isoform X2 [Diospyros lotus]|uniref:SNF1-related protein kinase regulatory subunit beta-2-like isoform X2 n=1 Tax=Diospyros lotus TaxID=55363 RepID=UPI00224E57DF|nr:SNF1-related protein kinase regulatory subunit beta-2-like isoform X2 [Diospyros lotus]